MGSAKRVGVVLSGCGFLDGAEVQEATLTLLALDRRGAHIVPLAPEGSQSDVVDHLSGDRIAGARRNTAEEAARITRGRVQDLAKARAGDMDALVLPGGYGVAKTLCTFATDGAKMKVNAELERLIRDLRASGKPMGFICIAPVIAAKVLGGEHPALTIGDDPETAAALEALGARHVVCKVEQIAVDQRLKVVSTPAYMLGPSIAPVSVGIDRLVSALLEMA